MDIWTNPLAGTSPFFQPAAYNPSYALGLARGRCVGCGPRGFAPMGGGGMLPGMGNTLMLDQMLRLLTGLMLGQQLRQALGLGDNSQANAGNTNSSSPSVDQSSASSNTSSSSQSPAGGLIGAGQKVLMIGDSHTVGAFGQQLDKQLRSAGAQVETYGASGSSANSWLNGGTTNSGWLAKHQNGTTEQPPWNQAHQIPKLADLIAKNKPDVVVINLGANFRSNPAQARQLAEVCKRAGTRVIWIGPPKTRQDSSDGGAKLKQFDESMKQALSGLAEYVSSVDFTPNYEGGDGLHYSGGAATRWADGVAKKLTGR